MTNEHSLTLQTSGFDRLPIIMTRKSRATQAPSQSATATASTVVSNGVERTRLHTSICTTWGIRNIHDILHSELQKRFKKAADADLDGISVEVLRALDDLVRLANTKKLHDTVTKEMGRMWKRRCHQGEPKKIGGNPKKWNDKFLIDIKRLMRDVKRTRSIALSAEDRQDARAYVTQDVCKLLGPGTSVYSSC